MRLNNSIRDAWVTSILQNIPKVTYGEEAGKCLLHIIESHYPDILKKLLKPGISKEQQEFLEKFVGKHHLYNMRGVCKKLREKGLSIGRVNEDWKSIFGLDHTIAAPTIYGLDNGTYNASVQPWWFPKVTEEEWDTFIEKYQKHLDHVNKVNKLRTDLKTIAYGCNTRQQLKEACPEFEKYLPKVENTPGPRSTALAIVSPTGLARELGWKP